MKYGVSGVFGMAASDLADIDELYAEFRKRF
jgi:hypothetical protein